MNGSLAAQRTIHSFWHALPDNWTELSYEDFLKRRRVMISEVIRAGFEKIEIGITLVNEPEEWPSIESLLHEMETKRIEFKETARVSTKNEVPEKVINEGIIKTVAAFINSEGGTLGIGISDDGDVPGIQRDLDYKGHDIDSYQNWMIALLSNAIGHAPVANLVNIRFESYDDVIACLVDVRPGKSPVFANTIKGNDLFYVRAGNTTHILAGDQCQLYIQERFS